jgi:hypothetical protein
MLPPALLTSLPPQPRTRSPFHSPGCLVYVCLWGGHDRQRYLREFLHPVELGRHFARFGSVVDVLMKDYYALVVYTDSRGAAAALLQNPEDHVVGRHRVRAAVNATRRCERHAPL